MIFLKEQLCSTVAIFVIVQVFIETAILVRDANNKGFWRDARYYDDYASVADDAALAERVRLLNPLSFIGTEEKSTQAKHYRIRVGASDADTSLSVAMTLALKHRMQTAAPWTTPWSGISPIAKPTILVMLLLGLTESVSNEEKPLKQVFAKHIEYSRMLLMTIRAQAVSVLPAPLIIATPFPTIRYQKLAGYGDGVAFSGRFPHHSVRLEEKI